MFSVRLAGGMSSREGNLQVLHKGVWGAVCTDTFTDAAAEVVCSSLGLGYRLNIWLLSITCLPKIHTNGLSVGGLSRTPLEELTPLPQAQLDMREGGLGIE